MAKHKIVVFDNIVAAQLARMTYPESETHAASIVKKSMTAYELLGHADVSLVFGSKGIAVALGGQVKETEDAPSSLTGHPGSKQASFFDIDLQAASFQSNDRAQLLYEAAQDLDKRLEGRAQIRFCMGSTFTQTAQILSAKKMMKAMIKSKDELHSFMADVLAVQKDIIDHFASIPSLMFHLSDPLASSDLISPKSYETFAQPYCKQLVDHIHSYQKELTIHICGDTLKILPAMADTGSDVLSLDQVVDLKEASQIVGDQAALLGNVDPVKVLQKGTRDDIKRAVDSCYDQAANHPGGFILGPGCDVPYHTPLENLQAYVQAGQQLL